MNKLLFLFASMLVALCSHAQNRPANRPNIVFILADDLGYGDIGINGQNLIKTPNIDRLAKEGMQFTQFYAGTSVCAPSRSSLMTGLHTGHTYIRGNKEVKPEGQQPIADSVTTVAELLQRAGYTTAAFGKWGLGPVGSEGDPTKQGFDRFYGYNCQALAHRYYPDHLWDNNQKIVLTANENLRQTKEYAPDLIQKQALNFLDARKTNQPFFLFLPYILPHAELLVPNDSLFQHYKGKFAEKSFVGADYGPDAKTGGYTSQAYPHATFAAMVARLDLYVGQVMAKLKAKGLDKNTLVIFTSDNGPHVEGGADPTFFNSSGGFRGVKRDLYEGGIREPFIAHWPGVVKPGSRNEFIGAFWDLLPTFTELAGASTPTRLDGLSFVPSLTGKGIQKKHAYLYWEFHENGGRQAVRQDNWKAVRLQVANNPNGPIELFDLAQDPAESHDIATKNPEKAEQLSRIMNEAHIESPLFPLIRLRD
ncbi:sulfatase-like hydrolase/transferase [Spirosoma sp. HMF4905]|uniref:Sulfatase-like hydrolase/transferase n=1 Tax=Spirosoma arboris TaxID=2682092 RepID=A0A7K1SGQ2_9BACT|nr:arylsulfatase [Spirosoma arboris]MVM32933.1 sulfatase-like hydrolase/transferase [Spirosoma arboris]